MHNEFDGQDMQTVNSTLYAAISEQLRLELFLLRFYSAQGMCLDVQSAHHEAKNSMSAQLSFGRAATSASKLRVVKSTGRAVLPRDAKAT